MVRRGLDVSLDKGQRLARISRGNFAGARTSLSKELINRGFEL